VQEPIPISTLSGELSPAHIPTHVITEDSIPPALEASAQAITSHSLNPDDVEIVTSATHLPAAASVLESTGAGADYYPPLSPLSPLHLRADESSDLPAPGLHHNISSLSTEEDGASNYAQLDPNDVRRLSFISFKDIVHSEQQQRDASHLHEVGSRDSLNFGVLPSASLPHDRAASPLRSPTSISGLTTPPSYDTSSTPLSSPSQQTLGLAQQQQHGDLTIETMRQALRKTASGDLGGRHNSGTTSGGMSPVAATAAAAADDVPRSLPEVVAKPEPEPASIDAAVASRPIFGKESMGADASTWFE